MTASHLHFFIAHGIARGAARTALSLSLIALGSAACSDDKTEEPLAPDAAVTPDAAPVEPDAAPVEPPAIAGRWTSPICEARPNGQGGYNFVKRDFSFAANGTWTGIIDFYSDETCTTPVSTASIGGAYELGKDSNRVHGAREARFALDIFKMTPKAGFFVDLLNSAPAGECGAQTWELGVEQDISQTGCSVLGIDHETCPAEYELVAIAGGQLFFGGRPEDGGNLCTEERRPITLQTPLLRAQ